MILLIPYVALTAGLALAGFAGAAALLLGIFAAAVLCTLELRPGSLSDYRQTRRPSPDAGPWP